MASGSQSKTQVPLAGTWGSPIIRDSSGFVPEPPMEQE
ncbi:hypothetical protein A2U01_0104700, partial [Trifolium medium]|nr:hypothetical protein [Trifolium medium]